ncbi:MAG: hypothetical protein Q8J89_04100 [Caulobacter sp.]|nr:hypothetical protein [Caulobacter sp.]
MRRWIFTLGGLLLWAVHFVGVYAIASLADTVSTADAVGWRMAALAFSGLCLLAVLLHALLAVRRLASPSASGAADHFMGQVAAMGSVLALLAILWQTLPTLIGY